MPRRPSQSERRSLVLAIASVVFAIALLIVVLVQADRGTIDSSGLAPREFAVGQATELADRTPFLLPDASPGGRRPLYVQHLGGDEHEGWLALSAFAPGQDDLDCVLVWTGEEFVDPCAEATFPANGEGLTRYATRVDGGVVYLDLRQTAQDE